MGCKTLERTGRLLPYGYSNNNFNNGQGPLRKGDTLDSQRKVEYFNSVSRQIDNGNGQYPYQMYNVRDLTNERRASVLKNNHTGQRPLFNRDNWYRPNVEKITTIANDHNTTEEVRPIPLSLSKPRERVQNKLTDYERIMENRDHTASDMAQRPKERITQRIEYTQKEVQRKPRK
jgi:hypothetical protein